MIIKNISKSFLIQFLLVFLIFLLDRFSKIYIVYLDGKLPGNEIYSSKFLNLNLMWNEGIAFGLLSLANKSYYNILTLVILIITLLIFFMFIKSSGFKKYACLMILGGALGNVFDRIFYNAVPDFIDFHIGNFHWFIFNVADIFISLGIIFLIILEFTANNRENTI